MDGKEKRISLGIYPETSLKKAQGCRDEARRILAMGIDPSEHRKATKAAKVEEGANSFEVVAREWYSKNYNTWAASHVEKILRRIEERGAIETAHRACQNCGQVFRYTIATGRADRDISSDLRGALQSVKQAHLAAITEWENKERVELKIDD